MMKLNILILIAGFCMLSELVYPASGIKCYNCFLNSTCNDEFVENAVTDAFLADCTGSCIKNKNTQNGIVHRFCSLVTLTAGCIDQTFDGADGRSCACNTNACNGAEGAHLPLKTFLILLIATFIFKFYN